MRSLNKIMLIGNLTRDPEVRYTSSGAAVANFGIATNKTWKDANGDQQESVQYHNATAWGKMAEICQQLLGKGMMVYVEGEMIYNSWNDEATGEKKTRAEVRVFEMKLLDSKGRSANGEGGAPANAEANGGAAPAPNNPAPAQDDQGGDDLLVDDSDLPF